MIAPCEPLDLHLPAVPESVTRARRAAAEFARRRGADRDAVELAVSEAVGNAVCHAYRGSETGNVRITAELREDDVVVTVLDEGSGMRPNPDSPGLGLGLPLIGRLADALHIADAPGGGTEVVMRFRAREAGS